MFKNGHFHTTGVFTLRVARVLMQTTHYALGHSFFLSNRLYRMSLRPPVTEQSARDPSATGPFFAIFVFPVSNVKRMAYVHTCHGRPVARTGFKI